MSEPRWKTRYKVEDRGFRTPCWTWLGHTSQYGYGVIHRAHKKIRAHRLFFLEFGGKIPDGLVLDHLCRHRNCVNPEHLEPVTVYENTIRGEFGVRAIVCRKGHDLHGDGVVIKKNGDGVEYRACRRCHADTQARYMQRKSARGEA